MITYQEKHYGDPWEEPTGPAPVQPGQSELLARLAYQQSLLERLTWAMLQAGLIEPGELAGLDPAQSIWRNAPDAAAPDTIPPAMLREETPEIMSQEQEAQQSVIYLAAARARRMGQ